MTEHALKIDPQPFADLLSGAKTCEIRNDDRGFQVGDTIQLHEREDADFTGRTLRRTITHIQRGYGLPGGLCVLSYAAPRDPMELSLGAQLYMRANHLIWALPESSIPEPQMTNLKRAMEAWELGEPAAKTAAMTAQCAWKRDEETGAYETHCGSTWHLTDGGEPDEHGQYFCHHCGKPINDGKE